MQAEDATGPSRQADLDAIVQLVVGIAADHRALASEFDALVDITRSLVAIQSDLLETVQALQAEIVQQFEDTLDLDEHRGARNEARQARAHSDTLVQRAGALVTQARALNADAAAIVQAQATTNGRGAGERVGDPAGERP